MSEHYVSDEEAEAAKTELARAIAKFRATVSGEDAFTEGWVLVSYIRTIESERDGISSVSTLVPTGQAWPLTRGLLDVGLEQERELHYR